MQVKIIGQAKDLRTNTDILYAQLSIQDYLCLVGDNFDDYEPQRRREKYKAYDRMKLDIKRGALLPSITLAVKPELVSNLLPLLKEPDNKELETALSKPGQVDILDGLQRTFILSDIAKESFNFNPEQKVLVEFWLEGNIRNLIYRIIVLNAGQKPMTMKHQIGLLFITLNDTLKTEIPDIEIFKEKESARRTKARRYHLDRIATAYQSFITKSAEIQRQNVVAQKLVEEEILDSTEKELGDQFEDFKNYLRIYADLDVEISRIYTGNADQEILNSIKAEQEIPNGIKWFGEESVMNSFFAALALASSNNNSERVQKALDTLLKSLRDTQEGDDPLALEKLQELESGFNARKVSLGFAKRKLLTNGFKEYFREAGKESFVNCWITAAE
ncbi:MULTISPECIES: hypothetical protein [Dolichospermum]|nr:MULTISPECIES: hypothetical protein [Dolichospermum]MDM3846882.1 hypothetical protein [Aphanizomenon gracile PMC638.10]MDM3850640.1 hypothetical protein [Aphanizomenon gracile PMC627.10]MDM3857659.1 hypothetical protein [Aphanizomenon gracile PMC649.10]MDM3861858.1 hypothetical protein [Aphanizomenon gracile PMC644.10]